MSLWVTSRRRQSVPLLVASRRTNGQVAVRSTEEMVPRAGIEPATP